jgi:AMMECR1 domain-containing protein
MLMDLVPPEGDGSVEDQLEAAVEHATNWLKIWDKGKTEIRRIVADEDLPQQ